MLFREFVDPVDGVAGNGSLVTSKPRNLTGRALDSPGAVLQDSEVAALFGEVLLQHSTLSEPCLQRDGLLDHHGVFLLLETRGRRFTWVPHEHQPLVFFRNQFAMAVDIRFIVDEHICSWTSARSNARLLHEGAHAVSGGVISVQIGG